MLTRAISKAVALAAVDIAAAVVDKLIERMPEIMDIITSRLPDIGNLDNQLQEALASLPTIGEQVVRELRKSLPFGLGGKL